MANAGLENRDWDDVLDSVEGMGEKVTQRQMQAIMSVPAKATLELGICLRNLATKIEEFNQSTNRLSIVLIWLTVMLVIAACLQVVAILLSPS